MRIRRLLSALVLASVGVAACSSGDPDRAAPASDPADGPVRTSTTIVEESASTDAPTTSEAAPPGEGGTTTGGGSVTDRWTAPGGSSPLLLAVGAPEPEFPAGADGTVERFPDGRYAVLVRQVDTTDPHVLVDVVELFLDDEAVREALADGDIDDPDELHGNFYIRNPSPKMRDVAVSPAATLDGSSDVVGRLVDRLSSAPGIPYLIRIESGSVTSFQIPAIVDPSAPE